MQEYQNEAQRRRKARLAKKARMQRRRRSVALIAAAVALVVLVLLFGRGAQQPEDPVETTLPPQTTAPQQTTPQQTNPQQPDEAAPQTGTTVIHVAVAGDLNVTDYVLENAAHENGYDFSESFLDVAPILSGADLALLNFEGNLSGGSYGSTTGAAPLELPKALKAIGVDAVQTANSAAIRQGVSGLVTTLDAFEHVGLTSLGTYADAADFRRSGGYEIVEVNGIRIALIAFTKGMDNLGLPAGSENCVNVLYEDYATTYQNVAEDKINSILRNVRAAEPDYIIALLHWGSEYNDEHSATQEEIRELLFAGGVDAIVGTHSHRVQAVEFDRDAGTFTAYSLGDFYSDTVEAGTNYSVVLNLQITRDNATGETKLTDYTCTPIYNMTPDESRETALRLVRTETAMEGFEIGIYNSISQELYDNMAYTLERIEYRLGISE